MVCIKQVTQTEFFVSNFLEWLKKLTQNKKIIKEFFSNILQVLIRLLFFFVLIIIASNNASVNINYTLHS
jgi:hypothetical protein